jgi:tRNA threonylcarbamoyladenosine biosynthesis protein TsaE
MSGPAEAWALGLDDVWTSGDVCIIEWPERAQDILPGERLWIRLTALGETRRMLRVVAEGKCYHTLLQEFRRAAFGG